MSVSVPCPLSSPAVLAPLGAARRGCLPWGTWKQALSGPASWRPSTTRHLPRARAALLACACVRAWVHVRSWARTRVLSACGRIPPPAKP